MYLIGLGEYMKCVILLAYGSFRTNDTISFV